MDLGKKVSVPKDIMLEELSLTSNRGSRLFKMRQRRSEKYTFESVQEENIKLSSTGLPQAEDGNATDSHSSDLPIDEPEKVPSDKANTRTVPDPDSIAPGYGAPLKDVPPERFNSSAVPKSYQSPWEQAIGDDNVLADALIASVPRPNRPGYKSFNRVATPFGGFGRAPAPVPVEAPQVDPLPDDPELQGHAAPGRPSFNHSALGWVLAGGPVPVVPLEHVLIPESDDL